MTQEQAEKVALAEQAAKELVEGWADEDLGGWILPKPAWERASTLYYDYNLGSASTLSRRDGKPTQKTEVLDEAMAMIRVLVGVDHTKGPSAL